MSRLSLSITSQFLLNLIRGKDHKIRISSITLSNSPWFFKGTQARRSLSICRANHSVGRAGKIHLMDEVMSVYRIHQGGIWSSPSPTSKMCSGQSPIFKSRIRSCRAPITSISGSSTPAKYGRYSRDCILSWPAKRYKLAAGRKREGLC